MSSEFIRVGPSIKIKGIGQILEEREGDVKVRYEKRQSYTLHQIVVGFSEEELHKLKEKAANERIKIEELIHDLVLQNT